MSNDTPMTPAQARDALLELGNMIGVCVNLLRPYRPLIARFEQEARDMENFGSVINPTLYMSSERRATEAIVGPLYRQAGALVDTFDRQMMMTKAALAKINSEKPHG